MPNLRTADADARDFCRALEAGSPLARKALDGGLPFFGGGGASWWGNGTYDRLGGSTLPGARANYEARARPLHKNAVVAACLGWIVDNLAQARIQVTRMGDDGQEAPVDGHPLVTLLRRPNDYYPARILWAATAMAFKLEGNAYWLKLLNARGGVAGLKWVHPLAIRPDYPKGPSSTFISEYLYTVGRETIPIPADRVVHFRDMISLDDERLGWRRAEAILRQVSATNEGATYTASILENMGVTPYLFTGTESVPLEDPVDKLLLEEFHRKTGGQERGRAFATANPIESHELGRSPQDMALDTILDRPVSEICALLRLSPMVVGFQDDARTYSNMGEARRFAHEDCIMPMQDAFADDLNFFLLPDLGDPLAETVAWDRSRVQALAEDRTENVNRAVTAYQAGICTLAVAQQTAQLPVTEGAEDEWYARPVAEPMPNVDTDGETAEGKPQMNADE
jgi:HK97 family phage portal protein